MQSNIKTSFLEDEFFTESAFNKNRHLSVMIDYVAREQSCYSLQEIFSQHFPIYQCFLIVRKEVLPDAIEDIQILFPYVKVYHRPDTEFLSAVLDLSKILDTQFIAAFDNTELKNKWKIAEAVNKILNRDDWKIKLNTSSTAFVALRMAFEKASEELILKLAGEYDY